MVLPDGKFLFELSDTNQNQNKIKSRFTNQVNIITSFHSFTDFIITLLNTCTSNPHEVGGGGKRNILGLKYQVKFLFESVMIIPGYLN